ncbi:MAG: hypothetical protein ACI4M9_08705 [Succinivibrio sp.]
MAILSETGKIVMVRHPVCGRFGIPRLLSMLSSRQLDVCWDGVEEISIVLFNARRTMCKILHVDRFGVDVTNRILNTGRFKVYLEELENEAVPVILRRSELETLLREGTLPEQGKMAA